MPIRKVNVAVHCSAKRKLQRLQGIYDPVAQPLLCNSHTSATDDKKQSSSDAKVQSKGAQSRGGTGCPSADVAGIMMKGPEEVEDDLCSSSMEADDEEEGEGPSGRKAVKEDVVTAEDVLRQQQQQREEGDDEDANEDTEMEECKQHQEGWEEENGVDQEEEVLQQCQDELEQEEEHVQKEETGYWSRMGSESIGGQLQEDGRQDGRVLLASSAMGSVVSEEEDVVHVDGEKQIKAVLPEDEDEGPGDDAEGLMKEVRDESVRWALQQVQQQQQCTHQHAGQHCVDSAPIAPLLPASATPLQKLQRVLPLMWHFLDPPAKHKVRQLCRGSCDSVNCRIKHVQLNADNLSKDKLRACAEKWYV
jgi:hypothetical protein